MSADIRQSSSAATTLAIDKSLTVTKPAGTVDGDLMVAYLPIRLPASGRHAVTVPAGWENIGEQFTDSELRIFKKIASGEPANYTWTWDKDAQGSIILVSLLDHDGIEAFAFRSTPGGTSHKTPSITTLRDNVRLLAFVSLNKASSFLPPSGFNELQDVASGVTNGITAELSEIVQATAGPSGEKDATSADTETGTATLIAVTDAAATETISADGKMRSGSVVKVDASGAGVKVISGTPGARLVLVSALIQTTGATNVEVRDTANRVIIPELVFSGASRFFERDFADAVRTGIGQGLKIVGSNSTVASAALSCQVEFP